MISATSSGKFTWGCTFALGKNSTMGKTITAASAACMAPKRIFSNATRDVGSGAITRSSISRVWANSFTRGSPTAWIPWNMMATATRPGSSTVPKLDFPGPWIWAPMLGKT